MTHPHIHLSNVHCTLECTTDTLIHLQTWLFTFLPVCQPLLQMAESESDFNILLPRNDPMKPFWDIAVPDHQLELGLCEPGDGIMLQTAHLILGGVCWTIL